MKQYNATPQKVITVNSTVVAEFDIDDENIDHATVDSFGDEWEKFNTFTAEEIKNAGDQYFDLINFNDLAENAQALDLGCGSGRWTKYMHEKVAFIDAVDPSAAIYQAAHHYHDLKNIRFTRAGVNDLPFEDESFDFIISLGVLHHIPNTEKALNSLLKKLKPKGQALIYLYYAFDNRGAFYKFIFFLSTFLRKIVASFPQRLKFVVTDFIAAVIYMPFISLAYLVRWLFPKRKWFAKIPLSYYLGKSWNIIRNDALDRFGTPLEQRFTKKQIVEMVENCGNFKVKFSDGEPYWHFKLIKV